MKGIWAICAIALTLTGCGEKTDEQLIKSAQEAVKKELTSKYKPGECDNWTFMASGGAVSKRAAIAVCDDNFNVSKGLTFSDVKVYRHESGGAVCGIVSGHTDISRIGARFVYQDGDSESVAIKKSKHPMREQEKDSKSLELIKLENKLFESWSTLCQ
ncbi:hypothetical protein [Pseudocitrobacter sp. MW920760]|uniref:hypothetical protein n=1 Tax=Pseudocitrobacter sp. MW920760 TaxID=2981140 RepID=UPI002E1827E0|nr:hypothetical protein [Pseudocitrobacter sp. MW920760]